MSAHATSSNQPDDLDTLLQQISSLKRILGITGDNSSVSENNAKRSRSQSPSVRNGELINFCFHSDIVFFFDNSQTFVYIQAITAHRRSFTVMEPLHNIVFI